MEYCAAKDGEAIVGNKEEIVRTVFQFKFNESGQLQYETRYTKQVTAFSYNMKEYTVSEREAHAISYLFGKLGDYDYKLFKKM